MLAQFKLYARDILIAALISFFTSTILYFLLSERLGVYPFILFVSVVSAALVAHLIHSQFIKHLVMLSNKVDNISIGNAEISYILDKLQKKFFASATFERLRSDFQTSEQQLCTAFNNVRSERRRGCWHTK